VAVSKQQLVTFVATSKCRASRDVLHEPAVISFANVPDGCQYPTPGPIMNPPTSRPAFEVVEGGAGTPVMDRYRRSPPLRARTESEALAALPSANAVGIGTLCIRFALLLPFARGGCKFDNAACWCGWYRVQYLCTPSRGSEITLSRTRKTLLLRRVPCHAAA
jgi:hypothetical protein